MLSLLRHSSAPVVVVPVSTDAPANAVVVPWSRRPYLAIGAVATLPLAQVLAQNGVDARRVYEVADANGITDPRRVPVGLRLRVPQ